jgi:hypothetical protein
MIQVLMQKLKDNKLEDYLDACPDGLIEKHYKCLINAQERLAIIRSYLEKRKDEIK